MSLTTVRASEMLHRNTDKHTGPKHPPTTHGHAGPLAAAQQEGTAMGTRDDSPTRSAQPRHSNVDSAQTTGLRPSALVEGEEPEKCRQPMGERPLNSRPIELNLQECPSFAEQRSKGAKPLFFERHGTLQHVHRLQSNTTGEAIGSDADSTTPTPRARLGASTGAINWATCSPSWEIARSELWLLTEAALLQGQTQAQTEHACGGPVGQHPAPAAPPSSRLASVSEEPSIVVAAAPVPAKFTEASPFSSRHTQNSMSQQAPCLGSLFARACSLARPCPTTPLGLGALPLLVPSMSMRSGRWQAAQTLAGSSSFAGSRQQAADTGPDGAGREPLDPKPSGGTLTNNDKGKADGARHRHTHVAYAAGVAAATSTAAAVTHAASAVAAGLAAMGSSQVPFYSSTVVQLGAHVLNVGSTAILNKFQSTAMNKSTMAAAEVVLGPEADPVARQALRNRLRTTLAGASVMWFLLNLHTTTDLLAHLDFEHDFITSARVVLNLATTGPTLMNNCRELVQVGVAVTMGVAQRAGTLTALASGGR